MSCDPMTHPDYQKQGIFVTLARDLYADLTARHGVTTVWGFPTTPRIPASSASSAGSTCTSPRCG